MKKIITNEAPIPAGHYSQAISHLGLVFVAGQLPLDHSGKMVEGGIEPQVRQTIENVRAILVASNSDLDRILKATIYIPDVKYWPEVNRIYGEMLGDHKPARAVIPCRDLHYGALLEMEVIAATADME
ncbi:MAG: Rid family detoxifying hydrolase [Saprospiraceae bacterium]